MSVSLPVFNLLANAAASHGLRTNDYDQYHKYLRNRIARVRDLIGVKSYVPQRNRPKKSKDNETSQQYKEAITKDDVQRDPRFLELAFLLAERANSRLACFATKKPSASYRLSRARRASEFAHRFLDLAKSCADASTVDQATFFVAAADGALHEELSDWEAALRDFKQARLTIGKLTLDTSVDAAVDGSETGVLSSYRRARTREVEARIRMCLARLKKSPAETVAVLKEVGAADVAPTARHVWRGREIEQMPEDAEMALAVGSQAAAAAVAYRTDAVSSSDAAGVDSDAMMTALTKRVAALNDVSTSLRRRVTSAGGSAHDTRAALALVMYEARIAAAALAKVKYTTASDAGASVGEIATLAMAWAEAAKLVLAVPGVEDDDTLGPAAHVHATETATRGHLLRARAFADGGMFVHGAGEVAVAGHVVDTASKLPAEALASALEGGDVGRWVEGLRGEIAGVTAYVSARRVLADDAEPALEDVLAVSDVAPAEAGAFAAAVPHAAVYGWPPRLQPLQVKPVVFDVAHALQASEAEAAAAGEDEDSDVPALAPADATDAEIDEQLEAVRSSPDESEQKSKGWGLFGWGKKK